MTILMMNYMGNAMKKVVVRMYSSMERKCAKWKRKRKRRQEALKKKREWTGAREKNICKCTKRGKRGAESDANEKG